MIHFKSKRVHYSVAYPPLPNKTYLVFYDRWEPFKALKVTIHLPDGRWHDRWHSLETGDHPSKGKQILCTSCQYMDTEVYINGATPATLRANQK